METYNQRMKIAAQIANSARAAAPVLTGRYRDGIAVESDGLTIHKEYGTSDTPAHAALTNAAIEYGRYSGTQPR